MANEVAPAQEPPGTSSNPIQHSGSIPPGNHPRAPRAHSPYKTNFLAAHLRPLASRIDRVRDGVNIQIRGSAPYKHPRRTFPAHGPCSGRRPRADAHVPEAGADAPGPQAAFAPSAPPLPLAPLVRVPPASKSPPASDSLRVRSTAFRRSGSSSRLQAGLTLQDKTTLTRVVVPVSRSRRKTSSVMLVSPATRFDAKLSKTMKRPSAESAGPTLPQLPCPHAESKLTRNVIPPASAAEAKIDTRANGTIELPARDSKDNAHHWRARERAGLHGFFLRSRRD